MIIFPDLKKIILHVPKTGGTFLKNLLSTQTEKKIIILKGIFIYKKNRYEVSHLTLNELIKFKDKLIKFNFFPKKYSDYKIYLFSRNVEERLNSSISECLRQNLLGINKRGFYNKKEIEKCLDIITSKVKKNFKNKWNDYDYSITHFKPQKMYCVNKSTVIPTEILNKKKKLIEFLNKEFKIQINTNLNIDKIDKYSSLVPYSNNQFVNFYFDYFHKGNSRKFRLLNNSLKKRIDFRYLFRKKFKKLASLYFKDKNL